MADRKISDLTALTTPASGDYLPIVDISEASAANKNKRITIEELLRGAPDGTAGAPGIAFESDPNTGLYIPGADALGLVTGGTERLRITSAGLVGIGTSAPGTALDVVGQIKTSLLFNVNGEGYIRGDVAGELRLQGGTSGTAFRNNANNITRLYITDAGLVGIGTTSPGSLLHLADAGNITVGTTTGTKIGTATTQKLGFYNATPVVQPAAVADATDAATVITQLNDLLAKLRTLGIIAT